MEPLPVVKVVPLSDVERLATHGGPRRIVLMRAESISKVRAMLAVFRAKGLLRNQHGRGDAFPDFDIDLRLRRQRGWLGRMGCRAREGPRRAPHPI